jgi:hypothetical protein
MIVGHTVTFDVIGPRMTHPVSCSALRPASACPHWQALDRGTFMGTITRGKPQVAFLDVEGTLQLLAPDAPPGSEPHVRAEIHDLLDAYLAEAGSINAVRDWLEQVT